MTPVARCTITAPNGNWVRPWPGQSHAACSARACSARPVPGGTGGDVGFCGRRTRSRRGRRQAQRPEALKPEEASPGLVWTGHARQVAWHSPLRLLALHPPSRLVRNPSDCTGFCGQPPSRGTYRPLSKPKWRSPLDPNPTEPHPLLSTLGVAAPGMLRGAYECWRRVSTWAGSGWVRFWICLRKWEWYTSLLRSAFSY